MVAAEGRERKRGRRERKNREPLITTHPRTPAYKTCRSIGAGVALDLG